MSGRDSLDAGYFDGIFAADADPWALASSDYEAAKFARTCEALADRRYAQAVEIGCAQGVLTQKLLGLCDTLLSLDISREALDRARARLGEPPNLALRLMGFPRETPPGVGYDLVVLSEVAYYWSDVDLARAAAWLVEATAARGRVILVHYTGETDYPQTGDGAVDTLWSHVAEAFARRRAERWPRYRLDLWERT